MTRSPRMAGSSARTGCASRSGPVTRKIDPAFGAGQATLRTLQAAADDSPTHRHLSLFQRQADARAQATPLSGQPLQRVKGHAGLANIKNQIHEGNGKAEEIAEDLYDFEHGPTDGDFTKDTAAKIERTALAYEYFDEHAKRLAEGNPYQIGDIAENTQTEVDEDKPGKVKVASFLPDIFRGISRHKLGFMNSFDADGTAKMEYNARNPALTTFHASDVIAEQRRLAGIDLKSEGPASVSRVIRRNIQSINGRAWWDKLSGTGDGKFRDLTTDELKSFLTETDNGKSTVNSFRGQYEVTAGKTIRYKSDPNDFSVELSLKSVEPK